MPAGPHELKAMARSADGTNLSEPVTVRGPRDGPAPTLHRVCVGVDAYDLSVRAAAHHRHEGRPGRSPPSPTTASAPGTGSGPRRACCSSTRTPPGRRCSGAIKAAGDAAAPGDLVVVFFAGHAKRHTSGTTSEYYLYTRWEADPTAIAGKAVSGADRAALRSFRNAPPCWKRWTHSADAVKRSGPG